MPQPEVSMSLEIGRNNEVIEDRTFRNGVESRNCRRHCQQVDDVFVLYLLPAPHNRRQSRSKALSGKLELLAKQDWEIKTLQSNGVEEADYNCMFNQKNVAQAQCIGVAPTNNVKESNYILVP